eukprot:TRINITY_DN513_c0_g2_i1.p2 TRINITY_DN513_c0_g2~~TRINITY_DN513_c0_g2_i1.p2  ORF type:complete len:447 (+),score=134.74 TRINITY_DN513_c0_g2_i1:2843-4183(+)
MPPSVGGIPWLGRAIDFGQRPVEFFIENYKKFGEAYTIPIFGENMVMLSGDSASLFFKTEEEIFSAADAYKFTVPVFGKGVVYDAPVPVFQEQRKFVTGGLTRQRFKLYVPWMEEETREFFTKKWGNSCKAEILDDFSYCTILTSTRCLQGAEIRKFANEFHRLFVELDSGLNPLGFFFPNLPLPGMNATRRARKEMQEMFQKVITHRRENPTEQHEDIVQSLMNSEYKSGEKLSDDNIIGIMVGLLMAGQHTSNVTSSWTILEIIRNEEVYQKCMEEQKRILGDDDELTYDSLKEMTYLDNVVKETLRIHPPIMLLIRRVLKSIEHKNFTIPSGSLVACSPFIQHRSDWCYTDPLKFDPSRFDREEHKKPFSYLAFGAGKHACIGESFAFVQVKTIVSWLLRNYKMTHLDKEMSKPNYTTMIISPTPPVYVQAERIVKNFHQIVF